MAMRVLLSSFLLVCFIFVLALNAGAFDESVILYLSFDGQNAKKAIDQTGNGNDGILKGNVKWAKNGKVNGAVSFDRSAGTLVEIPDNKVLDSLTKSTTMEAWVMLQVVLGMTRSWENTPILNRMRQQLCALVLAIMLQARGELKRTDSHLRLLQPVAGMAVHMSLDLKHYPSRGNGIMLQGL